MIMACLDSDSACGDSVLLKENHNLFVKFFDCDLPDPTYMGMSNLTAHSVETKFGGPKSTFCHQLSEHTLARSSAFLATFC